MRQAFTISAILCLFTIVSGCTRKEIIEIPPKENSIVIRDETCTIERLLYEIKEIEYLDETKEELIAIRVMVDGAVITADLPLRLVGNRIDLASRNTAPGVGKPYYTFYLSVRGEDRMYYRIQSWITENNPYNACGGWFSINSGDGPGEYVFEWELTGKNNGETVSVSTGYVKSVFERIPEVPVY